MQKRLLSLVVTLLVISVSAMAQITTSGISGRVTSNGEEVIGATVTATHQPSGTIYRALTNIDGRFTIQGMRVGGPYKVEISYIGNQTKVFQDVTLRLGEVEDLSCKLQTDSKELQESCCCRKGWNKWNEDRSSSKSFSKANCRNSKYNSRYC